MNRSNGKPATAYINPDGSYIVRDNITNTIVQGSDLTKPDWKIDSGITNIRTP